MAKFRIIAVATLLLLPAVAQQKSSLTNAGAARRSFQELVAAKDQAVLDALKQERAYVCFRDGKDEFLIINFSDPAPTSWQPLQDHAAEEFQYDWPSVQSYLNGATDPHGIRIGLAGMWKRLKGYPAIVSFSGTTKKDETSETEKGDSVSIDLDEFRAKSSYENAAGGTTNYTLTVRRSTGRFTEAYRIVSKFGVNEYDQSSGHCSIFSNGKEVTRLTTSTKASRP